MKTSKLKEDIVFDAVLRGHRLTFHSTWGLFSPRSVDNGSRLLIEHIALKHGQDTLDLGCGYGVIGVSLAKACPSGRVHMVDTNCVAVDFARKNAELNGVANCTAYLSNAFSAVGSAMFDNVVAHLPAKVGKELLYIIVSDARDHLRPGGQLVVVTVSRLTEHIKRDFREFFGNYDKVKQDRAHTMARAVKEAGDAPEKASEATPESGSRG